MMALLSVVLFFIPAWVGPQTQSGIVSGTVRDPAGNPEAGVRVAAMAVLPPDETKSADVLVSIGKTDEAGRYSLEIPQGRYYVIAGRVSSPTYYPNVTSVDRALVFSIAPGLRTDGIDFKLYFLSGTVRDTVGKPQEGARVGVVDAKQPLGCQKDLSLETETDSSGHYRLEVLPGEYFIVASIRGRTRFYPKADSRENSTPVTVRDGSTLSGLDIQVPVETISNGNTSTRDLYVAALENAGFGCHTVARLQFFTLIETFPTSEYAVEARYEMAESYFREGSPTAMAMADAMRYFSDYIRLSPNATRLPQARQRLLEIQRKLPR